MHLDEFGSNRLGLLGEMRHASHEGKLLLRTKDELHEIDEVRVRLLLKVHALPVVELAELHAVRTHDALGRRDPQQSVNGLAEDLVLVEREIAAVREREHQRRERVLVEADKGRGGNVLLVALELSQRAGVDELGGPALETAHERRLLRVQEVLAHEHLLLEAVQQRRRELGVGGLGLDDHQYAELAVHRHETAVRAECDAHEALLLVLDVVLVEHVVQTLVQVLRVDQHHGATVGHAALDGLDVEADVEVGLVVREVAAEQHRGLVVLEDLLLEQDAESRVVAC